MNASARPAAPSHPSGPGPVARPGRAHRSLAWPLAAFWVCLTVYATLHPFTGWSLPRAQVSALRLPWPSYWLPFDIAANLLAYVPLGALVCIGALRRGRGAFTAGLMALVVGTALSYTLEVAQQLLPVRVPSIADWMLNTGGTVLGVLVALGVKALGGFEAWDRWRERWLLRGRGFGLSLLLLWPFGLLFPPPLPFGLGQLLPPLRDLLSEALAPTPWSRWLPVDPALDGVPPAPGVELLAVVAGALAPCLLAYALTRPGARRLVLFAGGLLLGVLVSALSTSLNFGPQHALNWLTPPVLPALALAGVVAVPLAWAPARVVAAVALPVLCFGVAIVNSAPTDAYYAASLEAWERGDFIRFHGMAQWVGWLWPYVALAYLIGRVASRES